MPKYKKAKRSHKKVTKRKLATSKKPHSKKKSKKSGPKKSSRKNKPIEDLDFEIEPPTTQDINEEKIVKAVNLVKKKDDYSSFAILQEYLQYYIKMFGKKYHIAGCDSDEIEQECLVALRYKAVEDFNAERGKFRSFAILCMKRHLFSLIKSNKQKKRVVLNTSISLDQERTQDGESLSLISLVAEKKTSGQADLIKEETLQLVRQKLFSKLSDFECEVVKLYLQQLSYEEIADGIRKKFPEKLCSLKSIDNSLQRARLKSKNLLENIEF